MIAWSFKNAEAALRFFQACEELGIKDELGRLEILTIFAANNEMTNVIKTERSTDDFVRDLMRHYKILDLRKEDPDESLDAVWCKNSETSETVLINRKTGHIIGRKEHILPAKKNWKWRLMKWLIRK